MWEALSERRPGIRDTAIAVEERLPRSEIGCQLEYVIAFHKPHNQA